MHRDDACSAARSETIDAATCSDLALNIDGGVPHESPRLPRRQWLKLLATAGVGTAVFQRALAAQAQDQPQITVEMIQQAEWISGLSLSEEERKRLAGKLAREMPGIAQMREVAVGYEIPPALSFHTGHFAPGAAGPRGPVELSEAAAPQRPASDEDLAFLPVTELAPLVRSRAVSSQELTSLYLARLKKFDPHLHCVVSLTEDLALRQAEQADREVAAGRYRGPLHGIPWGAKDLIAYPGYRTTWGAAPFREQTLAVKATVARRLEEAGAVLVAKLTLGALAWGDQWFGGTTRNPWNVEQGSSGSSAGSASATSAGLAGFTLGSETLGSIVSPCRRCGVSGLRPTFGRVSRFGCMALSWSMDKIGPIARSVEDCAVIFGAIHGRDGLDPAAIDRPFRWPNPRNPTDLRVGYLETGAGPDRPELDALRDLGMKLVPVKLPEKYPIDPLTLILDVEAAAVFDELTRSGTAEGVDRWLDVFRQGEFIPAVEYLRANRIRTLLVRETEQALAGVDALVSEDGELPLTNLTGHPSVVVPNGLVEQNGVKVPRALTFIGRLFAETDLLAVAHAWQQATGHHLRRPPLDKLSGN